MEIMENDNERMKRALKRVKSIKDFYKHLRVFLVINILLLIVKFRALDFFSENGISDEGFINWFEWNILGTPIVWSIGLLLHALYVFKYKSKPLKEFTPKFYRNWEERQIEKFMNKEENFKD